MPFRHLVIDELDWRINLAVHELLKARVIVVSRDTDKGVGPARVDPEENQAEGGTDCVPDSADVLEHLAALLIVTGDNEVNLPIKNSLFRRGRRDFDNLAHR